MMSTPPPGLTRSCRIFRPGVFPAAGNTSASGLRLIGTYVAIAVPRLMVIQDNAGAPVTTADTALYFPPGVPCRANDQILDQNDGSRLRVVKVFSYPHLTVVWAARDEA